jgi:acetyl esterase/lipase
MGRLIVSPFRGAHTPSTILKDVLFTAVRRFHTIVTTPQEQWIFASTDAVYEQTIKARDMSPESVELPNGGRAHWYGPRNASKILVFFHGGGYTLPCSSGHMKWIFDLTQTLQDVECSISSVILSYSLAPAAPYPTQLKQACGLLSYLISDLHHDPSTIILSGDSAGGNLALGVLSHLLHQHPSIDPIRIDKALQGAILISPWVDPSTTRPAFSTNYMSDIIAIPAIKRWVPNFLNGAAPDEYSFPSVNLSEEWFQGLPSIVERILIWGGGGEVLIDSIEELGQVLEKVHHKTTVMIQEGAAHEEMIIDAGLGYDGSTVDGTNLVEEFILRTGTFV